MLTRYNTRLNIEDVIPHLAEQILICGLIEVLTDLKQNFEICYAHKCWNYSDKLNSVILKNNIPIYDYDYNQY